MEHVLGVRRLELTKLLSLLQGQVIILLPVGL